MSTRIRTAPQYAWSVDYLGRVLINGAARQGDWGRIAAVRLLVEHETWLHRTAFRRHVDAVADDDGYAWLDLHALAMEIDQLRASSSESALLRLACLLVGAYGTDQESGPARERWTLRAILHPLDTTNAALAAEAVRYAALGPMTGGGR